MTTTEECGPHCGVKDKISGHCKKCHRQKSHGNAFRIKGKWVPVSVPPV